MELSLSTDEKERLERLRVRVGARSGIDAVRALLAAAELSAGVEDAAVEPHPTAWLDRVRIARQSLDARRAKP